MFHYQDVAVLPQRMRVIDAYCEAVKVYLPAFREREAGGAHIAGCRPDKHSIHSLAQEGAGQFALLRLEDRGLDAAGQAKDEKVGHLNLLYSSDRKRNPREARNEDSLALNLILLTIDVFSAVALAPPLFYSMGR